MPNSIGPTGLVVATQAELVSAFTTSMQTIYGSDIDLTSSTPDGQMMMIFLQSVLDLEDLLVQINNMFDPDNAVGVILDQRVAINGIQRQAGTFTVTNVSITVSQALNLYGLDQPDQVPFTVADNAGNKFDLQVTQNLATPGTYVLAFEAAVPGAVLTIPNTITVPVTIVLGVTTINNPTVATTTGINEESDAQLKVRRQKSVSLASQGYLASLYAALENITGVSAVFIYENNTGATNGDGVGSHSIWVIVSGSGAAADIANAIYTKRNAGCGMKGNVTYNVTQVDGSEFTIHWDTVVAQVLLIAFTASSIDGVNPPQTALIKSTLPVDYVPGVNQEVNINGLATIVQEIDANCLVTNAGFSDGRAQGLILSGVPASGTFKLSYNGNTTGTLNWNDSTGTILSALNALPGLALATMSGSLAGEELNFNLSAVPTIAGLITVSNNLLMTVAPAAITFSQDTSGYVTKISPAAKNNQFVVSSANITIVTV